MATEEGWAYPDSRKNARTVYHYFLGPRSLCKNHPRPKKNPITSTIEPKERNCFQCGWRALDPFQMMMARSKAKQVQAVREKIRRLAEAKRGR